ncbi:MAG TPA: hypothetical protein VK700_16905 [Steroidobacteraceae bacterium]|jgi:hypothetical protein|nr:hypothetical protein [Steroidobacteraceae bacterium]
MKLALIHTTDPKNVASILDEGFRDGISTEMYQGKLYSGAWFSDGPLKELYTGFIQVEIDSDNAAQYELPWEPNGYRRWLIPVQVVNGLPRSRYEPDD